MTVAHEAWDVFSIARSAALADTWRRIPVGFRDNGQISEEATQEAVEAVAVHVARREVELSEALRELLDALDVDPAIIVNTSEQWNAIGSASARANEVLEGAERTHALVPVEHADAAGIALEEFADLGESGDCGSWPVEQIEGPRRLGVALRAAARGEHPEWPS
jgi:hypothetical protein